MFLYGPKNDKCKIFAKKKNRVLVQVRLFIAHIDNF